MADAKVEFDGGWFRFKCPKANRTCGDLAIKGKVAIPHDPQNQHGGIAQWTWDGNVTSPTFAPSVNCKGCWHGFIEKGRTVDTSKNDEPEL